MRSLRQPYMYICNAFATSAGFKGGEGGGSDPSLLAHIFLNPLFPLCAFAINEDGADKMSSAPFSKFLDTPLFAIALQQNDLF